MEAYYYYAACIFIISVVSVTSTLLETRTTMRRMREMARYICQVRVLRNGFWRTVPSTHLVPGDIYEISDPHLSHFPCDALLLTGDAIVNESMLTGESVPVSKLPCVRNEILHLLSLTSAISPELAKHFLFSGTKIVRVRMGSEKDGGGPAVAMVVRTGFNTTKGALVRSMLFPRPNKFRFYADSFRFIGFMAIIAGLGFIVSIVNFINLGVSNSCAFILTFFFVHRFCLFRHGTLTGVDALALYYSQGTRFSYHHRSSSVTRHPHNRNFIRPLASP
jgi:cation-transporting P-type ATPase 13A2